ncbi:MAG TPA: hypothetical protein VMV86_00610 [Methanosarcinales archaeon]|nr:hypothetical protein [Methanosarcinales archaeon]
MKIIPFTEAWYSLCALKLQQLIETKNRSNEVVYVGNNTIRVKRMAIPGNSLKASPMSIRPNGIPKDVFEDLLGVAKEKDKKKKRKNKHKKDRPWKKERVSPKNDG